MRAWRIPFGWAIVTALAVAISARMSSRQGRIDAPAAFWPPLDAPEDPVPKKAEDRNAEAPPTLAAEPSFPALEKSPASSEADKIRALLKGANGVELQKLSGDLLNRDLVLKVLREALSGPDMQSVDSAIAVLKAMRGRDVAELLESYLASHSNDDPGAGAAEALGEAGDQRSLGPITEALRSTSEETRLSSAAALSKLGFSSPSDEMVAQMVRQFENPDGSLRRKAIERIARLNPKGAIPILARALQDSNGDVRQEAVWAFSNLGNRDYLPLLQPLLNDPNPDVARGAKDAVEGMKGQGDP